VKYLEALLKDAPGDVAARFALSQLLALQDKHEEAIAELEKVIGANPDDSAAYAGIAQSYSKIGKKAESIAAYKKAIELEDDPSNIEVLKKELAAVENPEAKTPPPASDEK
jgi:tetratricopeptide (TPR) repeat protein